jgi:phosphonate transport system ATP-binding protein
MAAIRVKNLSKTFRRGKKALDGVDLEIQMGEMVALIGASGSGKSTLLRHIAGLIEGDRGEDVCCIYVLGRPMQSCGRIARGANAVRTQVGVIFQQFNLVDRLSVLTNVLIGRLGQMGRWRAYFGLFSRAEKLAALDALWRVGISDTARQRASTLSGGQQQRAAIARALVQRSRVVLADEPIASLDPASSKRVMETLRRINREYGITVVVSLHQVEYATRYCPRTVALRDGKKVYDGPSAALTPAFLRELYGAASDELMLGSHDPAPARDRAERPGHAPEPEFALASA